MLLLYPISEKYTRDFTDFFGIITYFSILMDFHFLILCILYKSEPDFLQKRVGAKLPDSSLAKKYAGNQNVQGSSVQAQERLTKLSQSVHSGTVGFCSCVPIRMLSRTQ
jgi:hypothetical protein